MLKQLLALPLLLLSCKHSEDGTSKTQSVSASAQSPIIKRFDFTEKKNSLKDYGIDFFFSDYPLGRLVSDSGMPSTKEKATGEHFYQLTQHYGEQGTFKGQLIGYSNRSDDVDTNLQVTVGDKDGERLKPNTTYLVSAKLEFFTEAPAAVGAGAGGSPAATYVGLVASQNPWTVDIEANTVNAILDVLTPEAAEEIGDEDAAKKMTKEDIRKLVEKHKLPVMQRTATLDPAGKRIPLRNPYGDCERGDPKSKWICDRFVRMGQIGHGTTRWEWQSHSVKTSAPLQFTTDASGKPLYLDIVSHSGYEGVTAFYVSGLEVSVVEQ